MDGGIGGLGVGWGGWIGQDICGGKSNLYTVLVISGLKCGCLLLENINTFGGWRLSLHVERVMDPNRHIAAVIDGYLAQESTGALLVTGRWGSGKTHAVQSHLKQRQINYLYVTANGTASTAELMQKLIYAAYPIVGDKAAKAIGSLVKSALGVVRFKTDLKFENILDLDSKKIIIIDDIERSLMPIEQIFALVNEFTEHDNKHVIAIGDEDILIEKSESYKLIKEKSVFFTITVSPNVCGALDKFSENFSEKYKNYLKENSQKIIDMFAISNSSNLRILNQVLNEFAEIYDLLLLSDWVSSDRILEFFSLYFSISCGYKTGSINRDDIQHRSTNRFHRAFATASEGAPTSGMEKLSDIFGSGVVYGTLIDDDYLVSKVVDGFHQPALLQRTVDDLKAETDASANPEWRNLWYFLQQSDEVIQQSYELFISKFLGREYTDSGVILHAFGILIEVQKAGLLKVRKTSIIGMCKKYVNDMKAMGNLPYMISDMADSIRYGSAYGLGFTNIKEPIFNEAYEYYRLVSSEMRNENIEENLINIINDLSNSSDEFRNILYDYGDPNSIHRIPMLHKIKPSFFVERLLSCDGPTQFQVLCTLGERYKSNPYEEIMKTEDAWIRSVLKTLTKKITKLTSHGSYKIRTTLEYNFPKEYLQSS